MYKTLIPGLGGVISGSSLLHPQLLEHSTINSLFGKRLIKETCDTISTYKEGIENYLIEVS